MGAESESLRLIGLRKKTWDKMNLRSIKTPIGESEPVIHIMIGCQKRFDTGLEPKQNFGLVVYFWHEAERINLHQLIKTGVRSALPVQVRI